MALIPVQHVVADQYPTDPDWDFTVNGTIEAGQCVELGATGFVQLVDTAGDRVLGIAGDNLMNAGGGTPYAANLTIGAGGNRQTSTQNRVSDFFDETVASSLLTVYTGGGRFLTDQYSDLTYAANEQLYTDANGNISNVNAGAGVVVGVCVTVPGAYPSGVPGTDVSGSITLGNYIEFVLIH
jgi:hypothetical protein